MFCSYVRLMYFDIHSSVLNSYQHLACKMERSGGSPHRVQDDTRSSARSTWTTSPFSALNMAHPHPDA
ncbi:unnamed protein product [Ranitomeya imitator]|uniref:Uncharacterized protein n=1 Tax=Ranitomeya imitator TaxID=111125 RepID=A0ABN9MH42_9NEOB|nr:unnamed protein product [Ranitomeya imitator]